MECFENGNIFHPNSKWLWHESWFNLNNITIIFFTVGSQSQAFRDILSIIEPIAWWRHIGARMCCLPHARGTYEHYDGATAVVTLQKNWGSKGLCNLSSALGQVSGWTRSQIQICIFGKLMVFPHNTHCLQLVYSNLPSLSGERVRKR